ncbi:MAG TPA: ATP-binding cassette domain-containing protein [Kofleriaceae bacterium]|jgi:ABC-2 type transport system ATP-binding protein|nr:ATP-binding cassette domain-containing protein [Kofleriaceae bacterium]
MTYEDRAGVRTEALAKRFGDVVALDGVDLEVPAGSVLGLLGHNGAGKTTMLRILTTLSAPTSGRAWVGGHDVVADPAAVRACIGLAGQAATVDDLLSARKNLEMIGRLYHLPIADVRARTRELLERVDLTGDADRLVKTFSGGMRRRLDLAAALFAKPAVLFMDEPTTGLDPHARKELWALLREHVRAGATLVLTTQYLDEADRLADNIIVLDHGRVVARGTPSELKQRYGGERIVVTVAHEAALTIARGALAVFAANGEIDALGTQLSVAARGGTRLVEVVRALDAAGIEAVDVRRRDPTLDDVFLSLTSISKHEAA